jgi:DNA replication protein DnaC
MTELEIPTAPTFNGEIVDERADIDMLVAEALQRRGIDPARMAQLPPSPLSDPRGNVWADQDEAIAWHTEHALRALSVYADGEFDFDRLPPMYEYVARWAESQKRNPQEDPLLTLRGSVGCGKTSQLIVLLRDLVLHHTRTGRRDPWYFITHRNLAAAMQPGSGRDPDRLMHQLMHATGLVILDDIGDYNTQDFGKAADATSRLINHRVHHRLPTALSTNLPYERGPKIRAAEEEMGTRIAVLADTLDGRVISRLRGGWTVTMPEVDHRALQGRRFGPT